MRTGDLIFTQIGSSANAISSVTEGFRGARVNHVGVVVENSFGKYVLEAYYPEVRLTNIATHIRRSRDHRSNPRYMIGRLKSSHQDLIPDAIVYGLEQRNIPYDHLYLTGESALYCSELIVDMFKHANGGTEFFTEQPMSFRDIETGEVHDQWISYYEYFGMPVPENEPGSNPGDISKDARLHIYDVVGDISGYQP
ncbi:YiiX/YebB-like N1pC/P60 family cysteine hydrolase [Photobacterium halotolerans]|uniref:YiiX/YebB-like N1pC/P60 family cysteine hydrolase n=1 Tax=Photobacterium halotolerans TaxID=265726 RepID=UPI0004253410|nr:YiiX/YebB-like N1pC/P60 family cysteine hydrolase [Photobacterium halotolerans]